MKILRRKYTFSELFILKKSLFKLLLSPRKLFNFFIVKISLLLKMKKCLGLPLNILIEPTGQCNYQCVKCERFSDAYVDDGPVFNDKNMPFDYYCQIIDEIGDTLLTLRLWHYGEPLLNKDLFRMIKYAKRKNILVALSSNLSLLDKVNAEKLIDAELDYLIVAIDGASDRTYNLYHGQNNFEKVVNNMDVLIKAKRDLKSSLPFLELQFIVMKENEKEMGKIKSLADKLGVDKLTYVKLDATNLNQSKFKEFSTDILPKNKAFRLNLKEIRHINSCCIPWEETLIRYSGLVLPCATDYSQRHKFGGLFQNGTYIGFRKFWNNIEYRNFRQRIAKDINGIDICYSCTKRNNTNKNQI